MPEARAAERGFTLIEVVVALVIAALLVVILANGAAIARKQLGSAEERRQAVFLAENLLEEKAVAPLGAGPKSGTSNGFMWAIDEIQVETDPRGLFALVQLEARISTKDGHILFSARTRKLKALPRT